MEECKYKQYEPLFGSWYITDKIGEGANGQVYVIERRELGVVYKSALKAISIPGDKNEVKSVMSDGLTESEATEYFRGLVQNFINEFIMMSKLKGNSHIVSYEDHMLIEHDNEIGWDILIRMELLTPLIDCTAEGNLEEKEIIKLGMDLCKALEFCRKYDIIHRDIKPENIFVSSYGDYKLGDFGIARTVEKTRIGLSRKGTYSYMAPEVYRGEPYGATVDIYSLGIVMYKLLNNNRTPFLPSYPEKITFDDREEALIRRIKGEQIPDPQNGSDELKAIISKAYSFNAADRFSSPTEMRKVLERLYYSREDTEDFPYDEALWELAETDGKKQKLKKMFGSAGTKRKFLIAAMVVILAAAGIVYAAIPKVPEDITGIKSEETIYIGDTFSPEYKVEPERFADEPISFETGTDGIITVNESGEITADKVGKTILTLTAGKYSEKVTVNVIAKVTGISGIDKTIELIEGDTYTLTPELSPEEFADEDVTYSIKDSSVASVNKKGTITAKMPGTTKLTVSAGGFSMTVKIVVDEYIAPVYYSTPRYTNNSSSSVGSGSSSDSSNSLGSDSSGEGYFNSDDDVYFEELD